MKVLLVEDDKFIQNIYKLSLIQAHIDVAVASDGEEGLSKAISEKPDLILLDMILPKKDGFDVLQELKVNPSLAHVPVIVISSLSQDLDIAKMKNLGATACLPKAEYSPKQVIEKIKHILK